jgi:hypothetical protein
MSSSQLTNSYFSEGLKPPTRYVGSPFWTSARWNWSTQGSARGMGRNNESTMGKTPFSIDAIGKSQGILIYQSIYLSIYLI